MIKPVTDGHQCSYVERVSKVVHQPTYAVIHWWGDTLRDLILCLEQHAADNGLSDTYASYWLAAFCLDQHASAGVDMSRPESHGFPSALHACLGVVIVLDHSAIAFKRAWVLYEAYLASGADGADGAPVGRGSSTRSDLAPLRPKAKFWDLYTVLTHSTVRVLPPRTYEAVGLAADRLTLADLRVIQQSGTPPRRADMNKVSGEGGARGGAYRPPS